jgi:hypothetical protein
MKRLIQESFATVTVDNWNNYVQYVKEVEEGIWKSDEIQYLSNH